MAKRIFYKCCKVLVNDTNVQLFLTSKEEYNCDCMDDIGGIVPEFFNAHQHTVELKEDNKPLQIFHYKGLGRYSSINDFVNCITFELE